MSNNAGPSPGVAEGEGETAQNDIILKQFAGGGMPPPGNGPAMGVI